MTPEQRSMRARMAAHARWSKVHDPAAELEKARNAFRDRFVLEVDPDGTLPAAERERRADQLRKAHYTRMALASSRKRRKSA